MKKLIAAILLSIAPIVHADEIVLHTFSYHTHPSFVTGGGYWGDGTTNHFYKTYQRYNDNNFGLGYRTDSGFEIGDYYNSYNKNTAYVAQDLLYKDTIGVFAGLATGYKVATGHAIQPIGGALLRLKLTEDTKFNLMYLPPLVGGVGVFHIAISYKIK